MLLFRLALRPVTRIVLPLIAAALLSACGGGSGGDENPPPVTVTVSGKITFDRIPFKVGGLGLNPGAPVESPARQVVVEALDDANAVLATATTDAAGDYSLQVPSNRNVKIRAKAQMQKTGAAPIWNFKVLNNTNSDALYALDGSASNSGTANSTRNLRAASGWGATSYTGTRAAAPFAILDTVYQAKELILTAAASTTFPDLNLYWSTTNRTATPVCPDTGNISTSFYSGDTALEDCGAEVLLPGGIYILGDFAGGNGDTDEFDQHVIAHEFGHYIEDKFARSDSIGGEHGPGDRLDLRVAFGEGWGNAYSAMVLGDPLYRDSDMGVARDGGFSLEADNSVAEGWFSEFSVGEILWDLFDNVADGADQVSLGFPPIFSVLTGAQKQTDALTSIFSFADALRAANPAQVPGINALLSGELISGSDAFGSGEANDGDSTTALPIYQSIPLNQPTVVCGSGTDSNRNKVGYRRFLRLTLSAPALLAITATGAVDPGSPGSVAASDPDIFVHRQGVVVQFGEATTNQPGSTETITQKPYDSGTYIIEVYDFNLSGTNSTPHCMTVSVTG